MKASTTSTCVMVNLLTTLILSIFLLIIVSHTGCPSSLSRCSVVVLTFSLGLPFRCSCSLSVSSSSHQSIHLEEAQRRRNSIHPPPVSYLKGMKSLTLLYFSLFFLHVFLINIICMCINSLQYWTCSLSVVWFNLLFHQDFMLFFKINSLAFLGFMVFPLFCCSHLSDLALTATRKHRCRILPGA